MNIDIKRGDTTTYAVPLEDAASLGFTPNEIAAAMAEKRKRAVSAECRRRIYGVAQIEAQMNMAAASALISSKTASARSDQEKAVLAGLEAAIGWVAAMRANVATLAANAELDFRDSANWPAVPDAAAAVAGQF